MLVISNSSSCDVCLESYDSVTNVPCTISCGHIFCQKCLDRLTRTSCPLCRVPFEPKETRRLHIDLGTPPRLAHTHVSADSDQSPLPPPPVSPTQLEPQRLQSDIIRVVRDGVKSSELRKVLDECRAWYKSQPSDQYDSLRVSYLLLYHLTETKNRLSAEMKRARAASAEFDELKTSLTKQLNDVTTQLKDLQQSSEREKELAKSVEKSLREHHAALDAQWKAQYDAAVLECRKLRAELTKVRMVTSFTTTEAEFYPPEGLDDADEEEFEPECNFDRSLPSREDIIFGLSPLAENMPTLPSSMQPFSTAIEDGSDGGDTEVDDDGEEDDLEKPHGRSSPVVYPLSHPLSMSAAPISIPRAQVSPEDTMIDIDGGYSWKSGISKSRPHSRSRSYSRRYRTSPVSSSSPNGIDADVRTGDQGAADKHQPEKSLATLREILATPTPTPAPSSFNDRFVEPLQRPGSTASVVRQQQQQQHPASSSLDTRENGSSFYDYYHPPSAGFGHSKHMDKAQQQKQQQQQQQQHQHQHQQQHQQRREQLRHTPSIPSDLKDGANGPTSGSYGMYGSYGSYGPYRGPRHAHSRSGKSKAHSVPNVAYP